jgi:hypothetical protein
MSVVFSNLKLIPNRAAYLFAKSCTEFRRLSSTSISETELPDKSFVLQRSPTNLKEKIALPAPIILNFIPDI